MSLKEGCALPLIRFAGIVARRKMCQSAKLVHAPEDSFSEDETFDIDSVKGQSDTPVLVTCEVNQKQCYL